LHLGRTVEREFDWENCVSSNWDFFSYFSTYCLIPVSETTDLGQQFFWSIANYKHSRRSFLWCICLHFAHISDVLYQRHSYLAACKLWCFFSFPFPSCMMCLAYCKPGNIIKIQDYWVFHTWWSVTMILV